MRIRVKELVIAIIIPLIVGGVSSFLTRNNMDLYETIIKPPFAPPGWLFPIVWIILYILMGLASYLVFISKKQIDKRYAGIVYGLQLFFNFFWSIIFFNYRQFLLSFIWLGLLWLLIIANHLFFIQIDKRAGNLLIPYLVWVTFAGYLNFAIFLLN